MITRETHTTLTGSFLYENLIYKVYILAAWMNPNSERKAYSVAALNGAEFSIVKDRIFKITYTGRLKRNLLFYV